MYLFIINSKSNVLKNEFVFTVLSSQCFCVRCISKCCSDFFSSGTLSNSQRKQVLPGVNAGGTSPFSNASSEMFGSTQSPS